MASDPGSQCSFECLSTVPGSITAKEVNTRVFGFFRGVTYSEYLFWHVANQPCSSYECHLTYGAVFGLSNRNFLTIWLEWSKSLNLITCSDGVNIFKISNVTALTARLLPIVKLRTRSRSRSGEGQEGQIWTLAVLYFWFSPEHGRL